VFLQPTFKHTTTTKNPANIPRRAFENKKTEFLGGLLLPGAFLVAIRFEALPAFVFRHLQNVVSS